MKATILCILMSIFSMQIHAQNNACINALDNVLKESLALSDQIKNMLSGAIALDKRGILNETVNIEAISLYGNTLSAHALGLGGEINIRRLVSNRSPLIIKDIDEMVLNHASVFYKNMIRTRERFDDEIPILKNANLRDDARMVRDTISVLMQKYKGGCTEFCVNGQMAGNRRTSRSGYDRKYKESSAQRPHRQFAG